jgi:hypothetical protein
MDSLKKLDLTLYVRSYIADLYWPEAEQVINPG